jgi:hypothetical protein
MKGQVPGAKCLYLIDQINGEVILFGCRTGAEMRWRAGTNRNFITLVKPVEVHCRLYRPGSSARPPLLLPRRHAHLLPVFQV